MSASVVPGVVLDSLEVRAGLQRRGLPDSKDSLSRHVNALFWPGEIAMQDREARTRGNTGYAFRQDQAELVWAAAELVRNHTFSLKYLRTLRRFARLRGEDELEWFQDLLQLARITDGSADSELLGRTA